MTNFDQIDYSPSLEINKWEDRRRKLNFGEKMHVMFLAYLRGIGTLVINDRRPTFLRGLDIGVREVEAGIKVGSSLMTLGTITASTDGNLILEPIIFFKDRLTFAVTLKEVINGLEEKRNLWAVLSLIGVVYMGRRIYKYHKKYNLIRLIKRIMKME